MATDGEKLRDVILAYSQKKNPRSRIAQPRDGCPPRRNPRLAEEEQRISIPDIYSARASIFPAPRDPGAAGVPADG